MRATHLIEPELSASVGFTGIPQRERAGRPSVLPDRNPNPYILNINLNPHITLTLTAEGAHPEQVILAKADNRHQRRARLQGHPHKALPASQHHVEGARLNLHGACIDTMGMRVVVVNFNPAIVLCFQF